MAKFDLRFGASARFLSAGLLVLASAAALAQAPAGRLTVRVDRPGPKISPTFYGLMTEEINHAYDGGLYAELIRNRTFMDSDAEPVHWSLVQEPGASGAVALVPNTPVPGTALTRSLELTASSASPQSRVGVANDGYWGIPALPHTTYRVELWAAAASNGPMPLTLELQGADSKPLASAKIVVSGGWRRYEATFRTGALAPSKDNRFVIAETRPGAVRLAGVSLFPPTYHNRPNGDRIDLMEKLGELSPRFLRLPGGNYLEGDTLATRFDWKKTIGDRWGRPGHQGPWGYRSSDGLGLLEYLEWCEDLHMQPVLAVFAGYALRGEHVEPGDALRPYVQDALDEIEYVTGGTGTRWGAERARDGHPKPFPLTYVEIGNEDWFDRSGSYDGRFAQFHDAIKAKYPRLQLIATMPVKSRAADVVDDHYYRTAAAMERDAGHYDKIPRTGPKIFVGEWASTQGSPTPNFRAALGDAAWLTGLERNSDLVVMESYAPLLVNVNYGAAQWGTNLIGYDALTSFGSPSFYVQSMFGQNAGDVVLPVDLAVTPPVEKAPAPHGKAGVGTWQSEAEYRDVTVTHDGQTVALNDPADWALGRGHWSAEGGDLKQDNPRTRDAHALAGDANWTDYTLHLQARKLGGSEGFLILFHAQDPQNYWQWNVGGWNDTRSAVQRTEDGEAEEVGEATSDTVEPNRWYDVRLEVRGGQIRGYLDGRLVTQVSETAATAVDPIFATASRDAKTGDVILKVVNVSGSALPLEVNLEGVGHVAPEARGWTISGTPDDVNTVAEPTKVAPKPIRLTDAAPRFVHEFPAYSVTVVRFKTRE